MRLSEWHYQPRHVNPRIQVNRAKALYFRQLNDQLTMIIERFLWFEERLVIVLCIL